MAVCAVVIAQDRPLQQFSHKGFERLSGNEPWNASPISPSQPVSWSFPAVSVATLFTVDYAFSFVVGSNVTSFLVEVTPGNPQNADMGIYVRRGADPTLSGTSVIAEFRNDSVGKGVKTLSVSAGTGLFLTPGDYRLALGVFSPLNQPISGTLRLTITTGVACTYSMTTSLASGGRLQIGATAVSGVMDVNTAIGCTWTPSTSASWIHVPPNSGSGPGSFAFSIDANSGAEREGTISIGQVGITLVQASSLTTALRPGAKFLTHIAAGGEWVTTLYLTNLNTISQESYSLDFYQQDGAKWALALNGGSPSIGLGGVLRPGETITYATSASPTLKAGWAAVYAGTNIAGYAVFRSTSATGNVQEAAVPIVAQPLKKYVMIFSATSEADTGLAVVNPTTQPLQVRLEFKTFAGQTTLTDFINLPALGQSAVSLLTSFPLSSATREGSLVLTSDSAFSVLGLKFNLRNSSFTSFEPFYPFGTAR